MEPGKLGIRTNFDVDDINAGAARVRELGGEANEPMPIPVYRLVANLQGTHGNEFGLWQNDENARAEPG
jgi:predicted enzyme related to lactoylglutathione lyase